MRLFYSSRPGRDGEPVFTQGAVRFCCAEMCRWWNVLLGFGVRGYPVSTSNEVNLFLPRPQASGKTVLELVAVRYCPWCGEAVEVCRVK
jgi:hypothetical protein